jgi:outer membrane protein TolC
MNPRIDGPIKRLLVPVRALIPVSVLVLVFLNVPVVPICAETPHDGEPVRITVQDALLRAIRHDLTLSVARQEHLFTLRHMELSRRDYLPSLSVGFSGMDSVRYEGTDSRSRRLTAGIEQLLFSGGRRRAARRIQPLHKELSALSVVETSQQVRLAVIETFVRALALRDTLSLLDRLLESTRVQSELAIEEFRLGMITELQRIEVELATAGVEIDRVQAENQLRQLHLQLTRTIGLCDKPGVQPVGFINSNYRGVVELDDIDQLFARARRDGIRFHRARTELTMARHDLRNAQNSWFPDVRLRTEVHAAGDRFPLTEPGFTVSAVFSFATALMPGESSFTIGSQTRHERSRGFSATARPGDNVQAVLSRQFAQTAAERAGSRLDILERTTLHRLQDLMAEIRVTQRRLLLLHARAEMEQRAAAIDQLRANLGEITRSSLVEAQIARSRTGIEINKEVVNLFTTEITLLYELGAEPDIFEYFIHDEDAQ